MRVFFKNGRNREQQQPANLVNACCFIGVVGTLVFRKLSQLEILAIPIQLNTDNAYSDVRPRTNRTSNALKNANPSSEQPLGDGCYHVFIDAGSNRGVHGRFLFEPEKYINSTFVGKFDELFGGNRTKQNICVFAFEPNNKHRGPQLATQEAYQKMGWRYHYIPYGVSDQDGELTFYRNQGYLEGSKNEEWGFGTTVLDSKEKSETVVVNVIDFAAWAAKHVFNRKIPERNVYNPSKPVVALKMDVEGSEFRIVFRMHQLGVACKFDYIIGEVHYKLIPPAPEKVTIDMSTVPTTRQHSRKVLRLLFEEGCPGWIWFDDESYLHDGMSYPEPP